MKHCEMKGFLSFLVLRMISKREMSGYCIRKEIERRRGELPSAGTIYPVLKELRNSGFIKETDGAGRNKMYTITEKGRREVEHSTRRFITLFSDMKEDFQRS